MLIIHVQLLDYAGVGSAHMTPKNRLHRMLHTVSNSHRVTSTTSNATTQHLFTTENLQQPCKLASPPSARCTSPAYPKTAPNTCSSKPALHCNNDCECLPATHKPHLFAPCTLLPLPPPTTWPNSAGRNNNSVSVHRTSDVAPAHQRSQPVCLALLHCMLVPQCL